MVQDIFLQGCAVLQHRLEGLILETAASLNVQVCLFYKYFKGN